MKNELELLERYMNEQIRFVESVKSSLEEFMAQDAAEERKVTHMMSEMEEKIAERKVLLSETYLTASFNVIRSSNNSFFLSER